MASRLDTTTDWRPVAKTRASVIRQTAGHGETIYLVAIIVGSTHIEAEAQAMAATMNEHANKENEKPQDS